MAGLTLPEVLYDDLADKPSWFLRQNLLASYEKDIKKELVKINDSFAYIGMKLSDIQTNGLYISHSIRIDGALRACNNVGEWAESVLDMSKSTAYKLIGVYERFCRKDGFIADQWKEYGFSQLCEFLKVSDSDVEKLGIDPSMSCRDIRATIRASSSLDVENEKTVPVIAQAKKKETAETVSVLPSSEKHSNAGVTNALRSLYSSQFPYVYINCVETLRRWLDDYGVNVDFPCYIYFVKNPLPKGAVLGNATPS